MSFKSPAILLGLFALAADKPPVLSPQETFDRCARAALVDAGLLHWYAQGKKEAATRISLFGDQSLYSVNVFHAPRADGKKGQLQLILGKSCGAKPTAIAILPDEPGAALRNGQFIRSQNLSEATESPGGFTWGDKKAVRRALAGLYACDPAAPSREHR